jgi:hypothetical protein
MMATCPRCLGPLSENHRCPHGARRQVLESLATGVVGALVGAVAAIAIDVEAATPLVLASSALGAVLASAVRQAVGRRL